jgi:prepilin-type processing-associated H-X9-DG protein
LRNRAHRLTIHLVLIIRRLGEKRWGQRQVLVFQEVGASKLLVRCPADTSRVALGVPRVRSISMNSYMGQLSAGRPYTVGYRNFKRIEDVVSPRPANAFVFACERDDSMNDRCLSFSMDGFDPVDPTRYTMVDYPASWHERGSNFSFADGHVETWHWQDERTMPLHLKSVLITLAVQSPGNADVARIQAATSSKIRR